MDPKYTEDMIANIEAGVEEALDESFANKVQGSSSGMATAPAWKDPPPINMGVTTQEERRSPSIGEQFNKMVAIRDQIAERIHRERIALQHAHDNAVADLTLSHQSLMRARVEQHYANLRDMKDRLAQDIARLDEMQGKL